MPTYKNNLRNNLTVGAGGSSLAINEVADEYFIETIERAAGDFSYSFANIFTPGASDNGHFFRFIVGDGATDYSFLRIFNNDTRIESRAASANIYAAWGGQTAYGTITNSDVITVERAGSVLTFKKNNIAFHAVSDSAGAVSIRFHGFQPIAYAGEGVTGIAAAGFLLSPTLTIQLKNAFTIGLPAALTAIADGKGRSDAPTFQWTKLSGGAATLTNANSATLNLSNLEAGTYTFQCVATWADTSLTATRTIVGVSPIVANAGQNFNCYTGECVVLDGSASTGILDESQEDGTFSIKWDAGDGFEPAEHVLRCAHAYQTAGVYTATLSLKNAAGDLWTDSVTVTVADIPAATAPNIQTLTDTGNKATNRTNFVNALAAAAANSATNEIHLPAGFAMNDPVSVPARASTNYVTVRVADLSGLPERHRVGKADAAKLARMEMRAYNDAGEHHGFDFANGAHYYRFIGIETRQIAHKNSAVHYSLEYAAGNSHVIIDRCSMDANGFDSKYGIVANCEELSLLNSSVLDIKAPGVESKFYLNYRGGGAHAIINCRLEAAGVGMMVGGASAGSANGVLNGFCFRGNHLWKNPAWIGQGYAMKNHYELKQGINCLAIGNVMENNYVDGQSGIAVLIKPATQSPGEFQNGEWSEVKYLDFALNKVLNTRAGYSLIRMQSLSEPIAKPLNHVRFRHNLWEERGDQGDYIQMSDYVELFHNTHVLMPDIAAKIQNLYFEKGAVGLESSTTPTHVAAGMKILANLFPASQYGLIFASEGFNNAALDLYTIDPVVTANLVTGQNLATLPSGNLNVADETAYRANFENYAARLFAIATGGVGKNAAPDGTDIGADIARLDAATASALTGFWEPASGGNVAEPSALVYTWAEGLVT